MRGTVAKRIRKEVYGDQSLKTRRRYFFKGRKGNSKKLSFLNELKERMFYGTLKVDGKRQEYQDAKRDYYDSRR